MFWISGCDIAGDGYCDDATNDGRCDFDGGDCCLPNKNTQYCLFCFCYAEKPESRWIIPLESPACKYNKTFFSLLGIWVSNWW